MGEEGEKIKQKKKDRKSKKSGMDAEEAHDADTMKAAVASTLTSENESVSEVKRDRKKDKEKKKKLKGAEDAEADMKNGSSKGELYVVSGENGGKGKADNAERNGESCNGVISDDSERKRKRRENDKKEKSKMQDTEEVKRHESTDLQEEASVSVKENAEGVKKVKKKQKVKLDDIKDIDSKVGEKDGEVGENPVVEVRKKKKKEKKKSKEESVDKADLSSKQQRNVPQNDEGHSRSTKEDGDTKTNLEKKKKKKHKRKENTKDDLSAAQQEHVDNGSDTLKETQNIEAEPEKSKGQFGNASNADQAKKKQKMKRDDIIKDTDIKVGEKDGEVSESPVVNAREVRKKTKKEKKKSKGESVVESKDTCNENKCGEADLSSKQHKSVSQNDEDRPRSTKENGDAETNLEKKKKKKHKRKENASDTLEEMQNIEAELEKNKGQSGNASNADQVNEAERANKGKKRKSSLVANGSDNNSPNKSNKKVRFSDQNEVFPPDDLVKGNQNEVFPPDDLVKGKRFTPEEDEIVKNAVFKYIEDKDLGDQGVEMILNCGKHRELKGCWKEIASAIPYRPYLAIYFRARILLMRSETRKWTQEEYDMIRQYQEVHGNKWKPLADELGKHAWHVKDTWRRIKLPNANKGHWSQEEYQQLFDLVNTDLQLKVSEEKKSKHGMLRDNICWTAISDELATRAQAMCCRKWYDQLTSPMVAEGVWADSDDYRLLSALYTLDATCMEDVEWDDLIDNRSGEVCRKRWSQMVLHIGHYGNKSFAEQVEVLAERYCPHLLEAREIWDNKPRVP